MSPTIDQLRSDIKSAETDLTRVEAQQAAAEEELATLEAEVKELGLDPSADLHAEAKQILDDVNAALLGVRGEVETVAKHAE